MNSYSITVDITQYGQPRPYADHIYEAILRYHGVHPQRDTVKDHARLFVHPFSETPTFNDAALAELKKVGSSKWYVRIVEPFTN